MAIEELDTKRMAVLQRVMRGELGSSLCCDFPRLLLACRTQAPTAPTGTAAAAAAADKAWFCTALQAEPLLTCGNDRT